MEATNWVVRSGGYELGGEEWRAERNQTVTDAGELCTSNVLECPTPTSLN